MAIELVKIYIGSIGCKRNEMFMKKCNRMFESESHLETFIYRYKKLYIREDKKLIYDTRKQKY